MPHATPLIATIVAGLGLAFILGSIASRLRVSPLVGYLLAGVLAGPYTPGFVADQALASELAELGVILLMFGVGLHFSLKDLLSVRAIAIPGAVVQIAVATLLGLGLSQVLGWSVTSGLVFGLALSTASTVVLLRAMQERRLIETERGRIAVGWLIVEDLAMVLALVLLPALAGVLKGGATPTEPTSFMGLDLGLDLGLGGLLGLTLAKVVAFVILMLVVGRRVVPWILHFTAHSGSRELFRLSVLAIALGVAFGAAELFGVSLALGAFFAGMVMSESELSHRAAEESMPLRDAFAVLFFVSVGMLFDPASLMREPLPVLAVLLIVLFGKSIAAFGIVLLFRHKLATALTISASLAQIGEFSFILAELGVRLGLLSDQARDLILAGAILSILLNPLAFAMVDRLQPRLERRLKQAATAAPASPPPAIEPVSLSGHTVLVGHGRVGSLVAAELTRRHLPFVVVEDGDALVGKLRAEGTAAIAGNAVKPEVMAAARLAEARQLVVAIPNAFEAGQLVQQARRLDPALKIIARAHSDAEVAHLTQLGADQVIMGEREIARSMIALLAEPAATEPPTSEPPASEPPPAAPAPVAA